MPLDARRRALINTRLNSLMNTESVDYNQSNQINTILTRIAPWGWIATDRSLTFFRLQRTFARGFTAVTQGWHVEIPTLIFNEDTGRRELVSDNLEAINLCIADALEVYGTGVGV